MCRRESVSESSVRRPVCGARTAIEVAGVVLVLAGAGPVAAQGWIEDARLSIRTPVAQPLFGSSAALDGDRALIGAPQLPGSAHVFQLVANEWIEVAALTPRAQMPENDFGRSVALDGDRALIGAPEHAHTRPGVVGSAHIFELGADGWVEVARLTASDTEPRDDFGFSVALDGDRALIGARRDDHGGVTNAGSAYVFELVGDTWTEVAKLTLPAAEGMGLVGWSVALDGDRVLVNAADRDATNLNSGAVYVFELIEGSWNNVAKLTASDRARQDQFGIGLALDGDRALIGANLDDHVPGRPGDLSVAHGSAYIFELTGGTWTEVAKLTAAAPRRLDEFGWKVALDGDRALIGAPATSDAGSTLPGTAYVFERFGDDWIEVAKITANTVHDHFGESVALEGDRLLVGANAENNFSGAAYILSGPRAERGPVSPEDGFLRGEADVDQGGNLTDAGPVDPLAAQGPLSPVVATSRDNIAAGAVGAPGVWDLSATDCTFKAQKNQLWVVDSHSARDPFILTFRARDLARVAPESIRLTLPAELAGGKVLGLAEVPEGDLRGLNFVLVDATFGTSDPPDPRIGLYRDDGTLAAGASFSPVLGLDRAARLSSIAVNPGADVEEIAAYDVENHAFYVLDFSFRAVRGPVRCLGFNNFFAGPWLLGDARRGSGMGITYSGPDTVLVTEGFFNFVEARFALEYDARGDGGYTGRALDLGAASAGGTSGAALAAVAMGAIAGEDALFALNVPDERLYAFTPVYQDQPEPVAAGLDCTWDASSGRYTASWDLDPAAMVDSVLVFENGVQVATLPAGRGEYQSPLPMVGKVLIEIATARGGTVSSVRQVCELENAEIPRLPEVDFSAAAPGDSLVYGDLAVTKTPQTPEDFRMYVYLSDSSVAVFDHRLEALDAYRLTDPVTATALPRQAIGLTLAPLEGTPHLAALDPNGYDDSGFPSVAFFPLEGERGVAARVVEGVDLSALPDTLALRNWDYFDGAGDGYYVAAGSLDDSRAEYVLVRLRFADHVFRATDMVPVPQRTLSPFGPRGPFAGIAVSVLPSGNLLVAGGNPFRRSYTEAVLATRFEDDGARFVGYAQGLLVPGQLFGLGPDVGPRKIDGLATAYFPPLGETSEGIGVTYNGAELPVLLTNPSGRSLLSGQKLVNHSGNDVSHPDLRAEQLLESDMLLQSGETGSTESVSAPFPDDVMAIDYYVTLVNLAGFVSVPASLEVLLDGQLVPEVNRSLVLGRARNVRVRIPNRSEKSCQVRVSNALGDATEIRVIIGAVAPGVVPPGVDVPPDEEDPFLRGDCNADGGVQLADAVFGLGALFQGRTQPRCADACDFDDNGAFNLGDMIGVLGFLFGARGNPALPGAEACGADPGVDDLPGCVYDACP